MWLVWTFGKLNETFPGIYKLPVQRGHKPRPAQTKEYPNSVGRYHVSYGVVCRGVVDGGDLGGEQIYLRATKGDQRDSRHLVLQAKFNTPESGPRFIYI